MTGWVQTAVDDYVHRIRAPWRLAVLEIEPGRRSAAQPATRAIETEGERVLAALKPGESVILLDERGREHSTRELASRLEACAASGRPLALLIGGPDGHAPAVRERAQESWSLSRLTLPHALARVLLVEQLYRAQSLLLHHPYHRD